MIPEFLTLPDRRLAYQLLRGAKDRPSIVFLGGYASDMTGTKASFLAERCADANLGFLRFDYRGNGQSGGEFADGTIGGWYDDARTLIEHLTTGPQIIVGSSMGGWIGLLLARDRPERVKAFVGIAAAPDFTEDLVWDAMTPEQRMQMQAQGWLVDPTAPPDFPVRIYYRLVTEARDHLLLRSPIDIKCPMRLLQGLSDAEVPWRHALKIAEQAAATDVRVNLIKNGDHRLSRPEDLELLWQTIAALLD